MGSWGQSTWGESQYEQDILENIVTDKGDILNLQPPPYVPPVTPNPPIILQPIIIQNPYIPPPNYDGRINVRDFGAVPNSFIDAAPSINAAINYAKSRPYGGTVYVPAGRYALLNPFSLNYTGYNSRLENLVKIIGDGTTQTQFMCFGSGGVLLQGSPYNPENHFELSGMRFLGSGWGIGLSARIGAYCRFEDLIFEGFGVAMDAQDIEQSLWTNCNFTWNGDGAIFRGKYQTTDPNSNTFINCSIGSNQRGMTYENANAVSFINGSFQYNGDNWPNPLTGYGIKFVNPGTGYGNVNFNGTIFEGNGGCADIWWHTDAGPSALMLNSTSFIRVSGDKFTNHSVWATGSGRTSINAGNGTTYKNFYGYVPSWWRKYIRNDNPNCTIKYDGSEIYSDMLEAP